MHRTILFVSTIAACAQLFAAACSDSADTPAKGTPTEPSAVATITPTEPAGTQSIPTSPSETPLPAASPAAPGRTTPPTTPQPPTPTTDIPLQGFPIPPKPEHYNPRLDTAINQLLDELDSPDATPADVAAQAPLHRDSSVGIIIVTTDADAVLSFLEQHGIRSRHQSDQHIEAFVPVELLRDLASLEAAAGIRTIIPPHAPQTPPDQRVFGDGPYAHDSFPWNDAGLKGAGVKVGIIDVGFAGAPALLGTELPDRVEARCYISAQDSPAGLENCGDSDHGTIVTEALIDLAPEASLYLASARSAGDLSEIVRWMSDEGVSVINMSLGWTFDGPGDGTSPYPDSPLNTLDLAVSRGIVWVNSAGNAGRSSWLGAPTDADTDGILELGDAGEALTIEGAHDTTTVQLRWTGQWGAESTDLDLHIYDPQGNVLAQSVNAQTGQPGHVPFEIASATLSDYATIQVSLRSGSMPAWVQIVLWHAAIAEASGSGGILSPADSANEGMLAVGATHWQNLRDIQPYSSRGPTPDRRTKPDITGADCGNFSIDTFCGTSQAAPHVAGLAALVRQHYPEYSSQEIVSYLLSHSEPRGSKNAWGAGLARLPAPTVPTPTPSPTPSPTPTPIPNEDRAALEDFYKATTGDNWSNNTNWMSDKPLNEWYGVHTNSQDRVVNIKLNRNNVTGRIPDSMAALTELGALDLRDHAGICVPPDLKTQTWFKSLWHHHQPLPTCRDDDSKILFVSDRDEGDLEIYVMRADSSYQTRLTNNPGTDAQPAWSPDGTKIAFVSYREDGGAQIYVMNADGSNQTKLTNIPGIKALPTWSPDGKYIAFLIPYQHVHHYHKIEVMNADGSNLTTITTEATRRTFIAWSPDSERLAYVKWSQDPNNYRETHTLFTINRDGTNPTAVFKSNRTIYFPAWIPEGHDLSLAFTHYETHHSLLLVALDGDTTVPLTSDDWTPPCNPHWSPDGKLIAIKAEGCYDPKGYSYFTRDLTPLLHDYFTSIHLVNADGTVWQHLTPHPSNNFHPTFSPTASSPPSIWSSDSKQLLILSDWQFRHYSMHIINADGTGTFFSP